MSFASNIQSLRRFAADLRRLPRVVGLKVAARSADPLTTIARSNFEASTDPYGIPWQPSSTGGTVTLRRTGALERLLRYVAIGAKLRVALGVPYAKYQIGKRPVFPHQGGELPAPYTRSLEQSTQAVIREELGGAD